MTNDRINITGIGVDRVDVEGAAKLIARVISRKKAQDGAIPAYVCTPNAEIMMEAQKDGYVAQILNDADIVVADGAGVVLAARILGHGKIARAPGFDLAKELVYNPQKYPYSYYFFGGKPGVAESAAQKIAKTCPETRVVGFRDGYFAKDDNQDIIDGINGSGADILFVALGAPKQEKWIYENRGRLRAVSLCIGVGGTLDIFAETARLAPGFFRGHGLEWFYRLYKEPWRARRMLRLPQYILLALWKRCQKIVSGI